METLKMIGSTLLIAGAATIVLVPSVDLILNAVDELLRPRFSKTANTYAVKCAEVSGSSVIMNWSPTTSIVLAATMTFAIVAFPSQTRTERALIVTSVEKN